jgi:hypothetical protein
MSFAVTPEQTVRRICRLTLETASIKDLKGLTATRELAACVNSGPLAARVSLHILDYLCFPPERGRPWLFLSYTPTAPTKVVIGVDPYECTTLHTWQPTSDKSPGNFRESLLVVKVLTELNAALLGSADYTGAKVAAIMASLHVTELLPFNSDMRRKYFKTPTKPLGALPETVHDATGLQHTARLAYSAARRAIAEGPFNSAAKILAAAERCGQQNQCMRQGLNVIAQVVARGFVSLCDLEKYRSPYAGKTEFICKAELLARLTPTGGWPMSDVTATEKLCGDSHKTAQESMLDNAGPAQPAPRVSQEGLHT